MGLLWPDIDEDISVASMLRGQMVPDAKIPDRQSNECGRRVPCDAHVRRKDKTA
jgi:hypothetical protein